MMFLYTVLISAFLFIVLPFLSLPILVRKGGELAGWYIRRKTQVRREVLLSRAAAEHKQYASEAKSSGNQEDEDWEKVESNSGKPVLEKSERDGDWKGIIGFFHPFCNAGGGGERVLWAAIRATQKRWPSSLCIVYTGDHDVDKDAILRRVKDRFNIHLHPPTVNFVYLTTRHYVLSSTWPHFTLLGQSLGSLIVAYDAFSLLVPDIFVDTMGYAFTLALSKFLFPDVPTGAYVHYPTISTDMLGSLDEESKEGGKGVNAGTGKGAKGAAKKAYWCLFARLYSWVGGRVDVVMTNSSWTQNHIKQLWGPSRTGNPRASDITVVFPPVAVEELEQEIEVNEASEKNREPSLLYIAQFRPEKSHPLILNAFAELMNSKDWSDDEKPKLVFIGSVRDDEDAKRVYKLRLLARELNIKDNVEFICDASWPQILDWLRKASIGVNGMWNEHFGIGVVEYQAAGLISVVNASGGPKEDIVVGLDDGPTGFHASTASEYAAAFAKALELGPEETIAMRRRARKSAHRFTEEAFATKWVGQVAKLVRLRGESLSNVHCID